MPLSHVSYVSNQTQYHEITSQKLATKFPISYADFNVNTLIEKHVYCNTLSVSCTSCMCSTIIS